MGSSHSSSRSNSPSTGFSQSSPYSVCAQPRAHARALASKAFDNPQSVPLDTGQQQMHSASRTAASTTRRTRIIQSQNHSMAGKAVRDGRGAVPPRPQRVDSRPSNRYSFDSDGDEDSDSDSAQPQSRTRRTHMPAVRSAAAAAPSVAYRGGSSLQRFSEANKQEVEAHREKAVSTSSSMLSKMALGGSRGERGVVATKGAGANGSYPKGTCDKCDGPHLTDSCPIYKKKRDDHPDAWRNFGRKTPLEMGKGGGNFKLKSARVIRQPGDGNCLFHSMAYGLGGTNAATLRREIAAFIKANQDLEIADTPMKDWVKWDSGTSVSTYASRMAVSGWGGGIEMAACSHLKRVNVHVYERSTFGTYKRISCFDYDGRGTPKTIHVLYCGGVHYDALVP